MDADPIFAGLAGPFDAAGSSATSVEALARLDLQAAVHAFVPLAPLAAASLGGLAGLFLILGLSALTSLFEPRGRLQGAQGIPTPFGGPRQNTAASGGRLWLPRGRG
jgi:hypothetical protein